MTDLVPFDQTGVETVSTPVKEVAISTYLEQAKGWLETAVEQTGPKQIAAAKAEIATVAEATKQLGLGKEIQEDAQEMVRRAEFALGRAIRKGQAEGTVIARGFAPGMSDYMRNGKPVKGSRRDGVPDVDIISPTKLVGSKRELSELYDLSSHTEPDQFEAALADAKEEGNVSRANVIRKVRARSTATPLARGKRAELIKELAAQGYSSAQMVDVLGVVVETVRLIARDYSIEIPADKIIGKRKRIDHTAAVESAVTELDNWAGSLSFIDFTEVDLSEADDWLASLSESAKQLRKFTERIRKARHA